MEIVSDKKSITLTDGYKNIKLHYVYGKGGKLKFVK